MGSERAMCEVQLEGTNFSTPGASQGLTRVFFAAAHSQLTLIAPRWNQCSVVDVNNQLRGSRVYGSPMRNYPKVLGGREQTAQFWPPPPAGLCD